MKQIEFIKAWGHPTKNLICGPGDRARVSDWIASVLVRDGTARIVEQDEIVGKEEK